MPVYYHVVSATSNATPNTVDSFTELTGAAGSSFGIRRVMVSVDTASSDARIRVRISRRSVAGSGGIAGTAVRADPNVRPTSVTIAEKTGTTNFTEGTVSDLVKRFAFNARAVYEWIPVTEAEVMRNNGSGIWGVALASSAASIVCRVETAWED